MTIAAVLERLDGVRPTATGWAARCLAHEDRSPSLSIRQGEDGRILLHGFRGCTFREILGALGLTPQDLAPHGRLPAARGHRQAPGPPRQEEKWETIHHLWRLGDWIRHGHQFAAAARRAACQLGESDRVWALLEGAARWEVLVMATEAELDELLMGRIA